MSGQIQQALKASPDSYLPGHGDTSYDVLHYDLVLTYKLEGNHLEGRARIDAVSNGDLRRLSLNLENLRTSKVSIDGRSGVRHIARGGRVLVTMATPIPKGTAFSIHLTYSGHPRPLVDKAGEAGWEELADGVIVAGQPGGAPSWFPCNDRPSSKATYRIAVSAPSDYHVVANGILAERHRKASTTTWVYEERAPMAPYLATVQIGRYVDTKLADQPVPQRAVVPKHLAGQLGVAFGQQAKMMTHFATLFGPYPFDGYTVVVTEDELEIPLEAQGLAVFGSNFLRDDWETVRLVAHELAHQWFGNSLTVGEWRDIWLHEGFACYAEWLWSEAAGGPSANEQALTHWHGLREERQDIVIGDPGPALMFDDRLYKRGALTLHAIRLLVGDDAFFSTLRGWCALKRHGTVSTEEFFEFAATRCGHDLHSLADAWLRERTLPELPPS